MSSQRSRKNKKNPHYKFLISEHLNEANLKPVNRETKNELRPATASVRHKKNADSLAQAAGTHIVKKNIIRSLITISLILILELVIYLAWIKFIK